MPSVIEIPTDLVLFQLPDGLQNRLQFLLDCQDAGVVLEEAERQEVEGLVEVAEFLSLLLLRFQNTKVLKILS
jgi:hypothetical protein